MSKTYVKLNLGKFKQATERARLELAKIIVQDTKQFVPHDKGKLEKAEIVNNGRQIIYSTPYARFLWHGKLMLAPNGSSWARKGEKKHVVNKDLKFNQLILTPVNIGSFALKINIWINGLMILKH